MADDDKDTGDAFDPWADLDADPTPAADGFSFSFEDVSLDTDLSEAKADDPAAPPTPAPVTPSADAPAHEAPVAEDAFAAMDALADAESDEAPSAPADDALATSWLDEPAAEEGTAPEIDLPFEAALESPGETTLGVFAPDDGDEPQDAAESPAADEAFVDSFATAADQSAIEIGTGGSGIQSPSDIDAFDTFAEFGEPGEAASADDEPADAFSMAVADAGPDKSPGDEAETLDFAAAAGGAAVVGGAAAALADTADDAAAPAPKKRPARAKARKKSGIGQMIGVVLGGAMAIPITLAILIWGFKKDPFKVTKHVPEAVAFLLPAQFQKGYVKPLEGGPDLSAAPSLDDLPSVDTAVVDPAAEPLPGDVAGEPMEEPAVNEPAEPSAQQEPATDDVAGSAEPMEESAVSEPAPAPPAAPEPPPLDTVALDRAVDDASTALAALQAVADPTDPVRKTLLIDWYKQLARMAEELALLEREAADTARPLTATPENVATLHAAIVGSPGLVDDLERLSRNWLAYAKRGSDGVVMPAAFGGSRRVGPYWRSLATIAEAGGKSREVIVISRTEPAALPGDTVLVTGLVLDGDVVWGADVRSAKADAAAEPAAGDPFATPDL